MFGDLLRKARKDKDWTLIRLAKTLRVSKGYLSGIENEKVNPPMDRKVRRLAAALGADPMTFLKAAWLDRMPKDVREQFTVTTTQRISGEPS